MNAKEAYQMEPLKAEQQAPTTDSKYIQQHLANERTYLAWLRTAIAVSGLGFLVANLHLAERKALTLTANKIAITIGFTSIIVGVLIIVLATWSYLTKRKEINSQTFKAPGTMTIWVSLSVIVLILVIASYFLLYI
jgi:putative membrane protein